MHLDHESALECTYIMGVHCSTSVHLHYGSALECTSVHLDLGSALGSWECTSVHFGSW